MSEYDKIQMEKQKEIHNHEMNMKKIRMENEEEIAYKKRDNKVKNEQIEEERAKIIEDLLNTKKTLLEEEKEENEEEENNIEEPKIQSGEIETNKKEQKAEPVKLFSLEEDKEKIKELLQKKDSLLIEYTKNQNEVNNMEMNFGQNFLNDKIQQEIREEEIKLRNDFDNFLREKQSAFEKYKKDKQMINFFELGKYNPIINKYVVPQIAFEFYHWK